MLSIYFNDKVINFAAVGPADAIELPVPLDDVAKVLQKLEIIKTGWVISSDYPAFFDDFCKKFEVRPAAGGVVADPAGAVLLILRNGRWDLPKGHREAGETPAQCAEREVKEECGVRAVAGKLLCTTCHTYLLEGRWILKRCDWFAIRSAGGGTVKPQREEGIERVEWVAPENLNEKLQGSFQTVKNVIKTYLDEL
jgi:8-oxo-dGTP pyrophosphatase MutT (NUDIX family)